MSVKAEEEVVERARPRLGAGLTLSLPRAPHARGLAAQFRASVRSSEVLLVFYRRADRLRRGGRGDADEPDRSARPRVFFITSRWDQRLSAVDHVTPLMALSTPVLGGLAIGLIELWRRHRNARIPVDPVEANALRGGRMSLRDSVVVSLQTLISNGCGASVGLEAGYTQIGAGLASRIGIVLRLRRSDLRIMVGCGAAGGYRRGLWGPADRSVLRL